MIRPAAFAGLLAAALLADLPAAATPPAEKAPAPMTQPAALPADALVLKRATITDPGVIHPGNAMTVLIPDGWTTKGSVEPSRGGCSEMFTVNWTATSADGLSSVFIFPTEGWQASSTPMQSPCMYATFQGTAEYLAAKVQQMFPGARVTGFTPREDFSRAAAEHSRELQAYGQQLGLNMQSWADGGELHFTFRKDGRDMRGMLAATSQYYLSSLYNPMGGPPLQSLTGSTLGTFGLTAPADGFNAELSEAVRRSLTPDADWLQAYFKLSAQMGKVAAQGTEERAAMIVAGGAAATKRNIEAYRNMTAATKANGIPDPVKTSSGDSVRYSNESTEDRMQRERIEGVRGVETYYDETAGQNVQLDATYDHAWRVTNNDTYILTNDPNFNPGAYDIQATQMRVVK